MPMADSMIAATAITTKTVCVTDDPHIKKLREVKTKWI
jgi:predicted nucleic acid-binding protein